MWLLLVFLMGESLLADFWDEAIAKKAPDLSKWNCVKKSIYDAKTYEAMTGKPVKIAISKIVKTKDEDIDHAQAIAYDGENMIPLTSHNVDGIVRPWTLHYPIEPHDYKDVDVFIKEQNDFGNLDKEFLDYIDGIKK